MPAICRQGIDEVGELDGQGIFDSAGQSSNVYANNALIVVVGGTATPHPSEHGSTTMVSGSSTVFVGGIPVCRTGDPADCGHTAATGSGDVTAG